MLTNKIFNASALTKPIKLDLCFLSNFAMLTGKRNFDYFQIMLCLLSKIFTFSNKHK